MIEKDYPLTNEQIEQHFNQKLSKENIDVSINRIDGSSFKYVEAQPEENYNDGLYTGNLEKYVYSGEYIPSHTKYVTDTRKWYDVSESYENSLRNGYYNDSYNTQNSAPGFRSRLFPWRRCAKR